MRLKKYIITLAVFMTLTLNAAFANDVQVWQDPKFDFNSVNKILIMPVESELKATRNRLKPSRHQESELNEWAKEGIRSAFKRRTTIIIKSFDEVAEDMSFIYGDNNDWNEQIFYKRALEMGYNVFVHVRVSQGFKTEHVPESVRTYTEYREIEKRDRHGRIIEVIRIPEEKTEIIPAHDVTYLETICDPALYLTEYPNDDYVAAVSYNIYHEYQGGPAIEVVENIIKASMKKLFEHTEKNSSGRNHPGTNIPRSRIIKKK
ncbi:MAG: hypothetical protein IJQ56_03370 [Synergistaceae bacterium]|nr:hypothetical protein [Synergistaceae bacterium]MBR0203387.1 hypothetical protein [Synergistaceae bacterium]